MTGKSSWIFFLWSSLISTISSQYFLLQCTTKSHWFLSYTGSWTSTAVYIPSAYTIKHTGPDSAGLAENQPISSQCILYPYISTPIWYGWVSSTRQNHSSSCVSHKWVLIEEWLESLQPVLINHSALTLTLSIQVVYENEDQQVALVWQHCNSAAHSSLLSDVNEALGIFSDCWRPRMHMQTQAEVLHPTPDSKPSLWDPWCYLLCKDTGSSTLMVC